MSIHLLRPSNDVRGTYVEIGVPTDVGHWSEQMYGHRFFVTTVHRLSLSTLLKKFRGASKTRNVPTILPWPTTDDTRRHHSFHQWNRKGKETSFRDDFSVQPSYEKCCAEHKNWDDTITEDAKDGAGKSRARRSDADD